jgi:hypothetical protein
MTTDPTRCQTCGGKAYQSRYGGPLLHRARADWIASPHPFVPARELVAA